MERRKAQRHRSRLSSLQCWWRMAFVLVLSLCFSKQHVVVRAQFNVDVGPFVDTEMCYSALYEADANSDGKVDANEYVDFVRNLGPTGFLDDVDTFGDLPFALQANFNFLACQCVTAGGSSDCCTGDNAHIKVDGARPGDITTRPQSIYLFRVCLLTEEEIAKVLESGGPTSSPSLSAGTLPTAAPSFVPSAAEGLPTAAPSSIPSAGGSTAAPSSSPTLLIGFPTEAPSSAPSMEEGMPTATPSAVPSAAGPTDFPVAMPSAQPTITTEEPSSSPTRPGEVVVRQFYVIQVEEEVPSAEYVDDLVDAMNILAVNVAAETFSVDTRRRRRLTVTVALPTTVDGIIPADCPPGATAGVARCEDVQATIILEVEDEDASAVEEEFSTNLNKALQAGAGQVALDQVNPDSEVRILGPLPDEAITPTPGPTVFSTGGDSSSLSGGAIAGIAVGAGFLAFGIIGLFVARQRRQDRKSDRYFPASPDTLGASGPDYGKKSRGEIVEFSSVEDGDDAEAGLAGSGDRSQDSSSNAGSSGWSSSAGVSSLNTGSNDSVDYEKGAGGAAVAGATLAGIGAASGIAASKKDRDAEDVPEIPTVTRTDLDNAIEAGDWAAVGATAALLAAASDSQSFSSRSRRSGSQAGSTVSSIDAARAAELDHLVDAGDWEGVVLAAAKFEASEGDSNKSGSASQETGTIGTSSAYTPSRSSESVSSTPSKAQKRAEIRAEVEALVRRVVPDEIDNVDEMMLQFKGREEELVETLRTMQERSIAQKARAAGQKSAKREARRSAAAAAAAPTATAAPSGGGAAAAAAPSGGGGLSAGAAAGIAAGATAAVGVAAVAATAATKKGKDDKKEPPIDDKKAKSDEPPALAPEVMPDHTESGSESSAKKRRTALEIAIEAGDWEAVGEAAAMMSDTSVTTASTDEIKALAAGQSYSGGTDDSKSPKRLKTGVNAERAAELDVMIDKGDWTGVVAAASEYSKRSPDSKSSSSPDKSSSSSSGQRRTWFGGKSSDKKPAAAAAVKRDSPSDKDKTLQEEQDALAQAEIWMAIAEQSKTEGTTEAAGASDAADWAIARSLSALRQAEDQGDLKQSSEGKETTKDTHEEESTGDSV